MTTEMNTYICRISRTTKVYKNPDDIKPSTYSILDRSMFLSYMQVTNGSNTIFQITAPLEQDKPKEDIPYDFWVPQAFVEYYTIEDKNPEITLFKPTKEYFIVNDDEIAIFKNSRSLNPLKLRVEKGDFIETDSVIEFAYDKKWIPRYRIKLINENSTYPVVGMWIEGNIKVSTNKNMTHIEKVRLISVDSNSREYMNRKRDLETSYYDIESNTLEAAGFDRLDTNPKTENTNNKITDATHFYGHTINPDVVDRAIEIASKDSVGLDKDKFTGTNIVGGGGYQYWYYYIAAARDLGKAEFTRQIDGKEFSAKNSDYYAITATLIRVAYAEGDDTTATKWQNKLESAGVAALYPINEKIKGTDSTTTVATDANGNGITNAVDNDIANDNVTQYSQLASVDWEALRAERESQLADLAGSIEQISMDELYKRYGMYFTEENDITKVPLGRLSFVHGMPFQYTFLTDRRNNDDAMYGREAYNTEMPIKSGDIDMYGRTFAREIAANTPIVVFTPGRPKFMTNIKQSIFGYAGKENDARNAFATLFADLSDFQIGDALKEMYDDNEDEIFQYYSLEVDVGTYYNLVDSLCQFSAKLMKLEDYTMRGTSCIRFRWGTYNQNEAHDYSAREEVVGVADGVSFAFDPLSSIQDDISNSTQESQFAGLFNGISEKSRELSFILGTGVGDTDLDLIDTDEYTAKLASLHEGAFSNLSNPLSVATNMLKNAAHGMRIRFPQLWTDSSYSKSYSLDMKFLTPYATQFCKWRYVLVPFFHIFALAAPQSKDTIINYARPFLIKAFSRGYFNIEMGIIDQISWKRYGDGEMLSIDTIPTEIDVSVNIIDLYQQLAASTHYGDSGAISLNRIKVFFNNSGLQELLGSLAGIDTNRVTLSDRVMLYASTAVGAFKGSFFSVPKHFFERYTRRLNKWFYGMTGT